MGDDRRYPAHWPLLSRYIRSMRAQRQCECQGECGLHRTNPGPRRCEEQDREPAKWARGQVVLTVAHLCQDAACANIDHLRAMCNRCHLRYDHAYHMRKQAEHRRVRIERAGQLTFLA